jgi:hypothetical protein
MEKSSTSIAIKKMHIKATLRFFYIAPVKMAIRRKHTTTNASKDVGEKEPSYTVGGNVK